MLSATLLARIGANSTKSVFEADWWDCLFATIFYKSLASGNTCLHTRDSRVSAEKAPAHSSVSTSTHETILAVISRFIGSAADDPFTTMSRR